MKKVLFMLAMLTCIFASCSDGDSEDPINPTPKPEEVKAEITIDSSIVSNGLSFEAKAGENSISFTTNANWTLTVAPTTSGVIWCKASIINGTKGSATVKFTVEENTSYEDRSVSVTIKAGTVSKTFTITQKAADALLVTTNKFEVAQEGGKIDVEVKANIDYQIEITETAKSWISETSSRTLNTYKHSFTIAANEEADKREGEITFKSGDKVDTVKVYQVGGAVLLLSRNECTISDAGGSVSVDVKSNVEYGVQMPDVAWITDSSHSHGRGMSSHTLEYIVEPNENYDNRSAEIIFYDLNSELKDTLKVVQTQKNAIIISKKEFELNYKEQSFEIELLANVEFNVVVADSAKEWINHIETRSLDPQKLTFNVKENDTFKNRNGNIYIWNKESSLIDTIKINQSTLRFTLIDESELGQYYIGGSMLLTENGMYIATKTDSLNYTQVVVGDLTDEDKESCIMAKFNDKGQLSFISYKEDSYYLYNYRNNMVDMISNENGNFSKSELDITELLQNINGKGRTSNEGVSQNHYWEVSSWIFFFWKNIGKKGTKIALELLLDRVPLLELVMGEKAKDFKEKFIEGIDLILDYFVERENKENELKLFLYDYMAKSCKTHTLDPEKISNFTYRIGMSIEGANTIPARFKENTMYGLLYCKSNSFLQGLNVYDNFNYVIFGKNPENGSLYATLPDLEPGYWYYYRAFIIPYYETYNIKQQSEDKYVLSSGSAIDSYIYYGELKHFNISHGKITDIQEVEKSYFNSDYMHFPIKVYAEHYFEDIPDNPLKEWGVVVYKDNEKMSQHTIGGASINDPNVTQSDFGRYKNIPRKGSVKFPVKINKDDMRRIENTYTAVTKNEWSLGVYCYISNTAGSSHLFYEERWPLELTYDQKPIASTGTTNSTTTNSAFVEATYTNYSFWNGICGIEYTSDDGNVQHVIAICEENKPIEIPLTDLQPNTTYSYRAYIEVEGEKIYGEENSFVTEEDDSLIESIQTISTYPYKTHVSDSIFDSKINFKLELIGKTLKEKKHYLYYVVDDDTIKLDSKYTIKGNDNFVINADLHLSDKELDIDISNYIAQKTIKIGLYYISNYTVVYTQSRNHTLLYDEKPKLEIKNLSDVVVEKKELYYAAPTTRTYFSYRTYYNFDYVISGSFWISRMRALEGYCTNGSFDGINRVMYWTHQGDSYYIVKDMKSTYTMHCDYNDRKANDYWDGIGDLGLKHSDYIYIITIDGKEKDKTEFRWNDDLDNPTVSM